MTLFRSTGVLLALGLLVATVQVNYVSLVEAYGSGPPYFGRTTNMDKWSSPWPGLLMIDAFVLLIVVAAVAMFLRRKAEHRALSEVSAQAPDSLDDSEDSDGDPPRSI